MAKKGTENLAALGALRGAASLVVAVAHAWQIFLLPYVGDGLPMSILGGAATWSVSVFFLLSGMLIAMSIQRRALGGFSLPSYVEARIVRIYPPLIAAVFITITIVIAIEWIGLYGAEAYRLPGDLGAAREKADFAWGQVLPTLLLTYQLIPGSNFLMINGPLWSLSFEFWLYILAGLGASAVLNRSTGSMIGAIFLAILMFVVSPATAPPFFLVAAVWWLGFYFGWTGSETRNSLARNWLVVCCAAVIVALIAGWSDTLKFLIAPYSGTRQHIFYFTISVLLLVGISLIIRREKSGAIMRLLNWAASFSYTLYLIHFPIYLISLSLFRPAILGLGVAGGVCLAIASLIAVIALSWSLARIVEDKRRMQSLIPAWMRRIPSFQ